MSERPFVSVRLVFDDGGRELSGRKGRVNDCVVRSISIVTGLPYDAVYAEVMRRGRIGYKRKHYSPRWGVDTTRVWFQNYMISLGFVWHKLKRGTLIGAIAHLRGRFVVDMRRHYAAMVDGVVHDVFDCTLRSNRRICGYWEWRGDKSACAGSSVEIDKAE